LKPTATSYGGTRDAEISAREAARRTQRKNNLKQIELAGLNHADMHWHFPAVGDSIGPRIQKKYQDRSFAGEFRGSRQRWFSFT
jgi:Protein of unknown function (DUF1559)